MIGQANLNCLAFFISLMTQKEISFAENYLTTFNATDAATKAGYSDRTAQQIGYVNLTKLYIKKYIQSKASEILEGMVVRQERVLREITAIAFTDVSVFLNNDWTLKPIDEIPKSKLGGINFQKMAKGLRPMISLRPFLYCGN